CSGCAHPRCSDVPNTHVPPKFLAPGSTTGVRLGHRRLSETLGVPRAYGVFERSFNTGLEDLHPGLTDSSGIPKRQEWGSNPGPQNRGMVALYTTELSLWISESRI
ncbi:hypothetical protein HDU97_009099, partial [Phlyctochytrium planicorne]